MEFKFNKKGIDKMMKDIEKDVRNSVPEKVSIDLDDSESKQISDVKRQFKKKGTTLSTSEARSITRDIKKGK